MDSISPESRKQIETAMAAALSADKKDAAAANAALEKAIDNAQ